MGRLGLFPSNHCFSLLGQGPWGTEVLGARVCWPGKKASCAGLRERKKVKGVKKATCTSRPEAELLSVSHGSQWPACSRGRPGSRLALTLFRKPMVFWSYISFSLSST